MLFTRICSGQEQVSRLAEAYRAATDGVAGAAEDRPFVPHITVARIKRARIGEEDPALARLRRRLEQRVSPVRIDAIHVYRSILSPRGARYEVLQVHRLGEEGRT